jgi:hypothetical protein
MYSHGGDWILIQPGYPIRTFTGRSVFAAHRDLTQLITSFIACWHQGIHHALLVAFIFFDILKFLLAAHDIKITDSQTQLINWKLYFLP